MQTEIVCRAQPITTKHKTHCESKIMKINIPKGWRKLRKGTKLERNDKFYDEATEWWWCVSYCCGSYAKHRSGVYLKSYTYIRRITKKGKL